jgi:fibronectin-binding autotransporter adhesin
MFAISLRAGTTWDGGGGTMSWGTANNWNPNGLPLFDGTETITLGNGVTSGSTLTLDGTRYINSLTISTTNGFTISAGTGGTLNLKSGYILRQDGGGTEAVHTIAAGIVLGDPSGAVGYTGTWNIGGSNSLDITGNVTEVGGSRSVNKTGAGTVILTGTNSFSGGLTLTAGVVSVSSNSNLGAASGVLTFNGGTLQVTQDITAARAIAMTGAGTFDIAIGKTMQDSGVISGNGTLTLTSFGTLILSGSGSNGTGATSVAGVLSLRGTVALGTGNLALNTGILELGNGNFTRALGTGAGQVNMSSSSGFAAYGADRVVNLGGSGAAVTWGAGNFLVTGTAFYLGSATADHTVDFQNGINLNAATRSFQTLRGVGSVPEAKLSGVISGTGASNFSLDAVTGYAAGSLVLSNGGNSYAGTTTINAGNLLLAANATGTAGNTVLGSGSSDILVGNTTGAYDAGLLTNNSVTVSRNVRAQSGNTGVITLGGNSASTSTFSGNIFLGTTSGAGKGVTLTAAAGGTTTFSGMIQDPTGVVGPGSVTKSGAGTVVLGGVNNYAGATIVNAGTLILSGGAPGALNTTSGITVNSGGTLLLGASDQIKNTAPMTLAGGTFAKGNFSEGGIAASGVGALTLTATGSHLDFGTGTVGTLTFANFSPGTFTLTIDNWSGTVASAGATGTDRLIFNSDQTANLNNFSFTGYASGAVEFSLGGGFYEVVPAAAAPEPSTWIGAGLAVGVVGVNILRRRRNKRTASGQNWGKFPLPAARELHQLSPNNPPSVCPRGRCRETTN